MAELCLSATPGIIAEIRFLGGLEENSCGRGVAKGGKGWMQTSDRKSPGQELDLPMGKHETPPGDAEPWGHAEVLARDLAPRSCRGTRAFPHQQCLREGPGVGQGGEEGGRRSMSQGQGDSRRGTEGQGHVCTWVCV